MSKQQQKIMKSKAKKKPHKGWITQRLLSDLDGHLGGGFTTVIQLVWYPVLRFEPSQSSQQMCTEMDTQLKT